jgi:aldehyde dehydrogenase (NAD+)
VDLDVPGHFVGGRWHTAEGAERLPVINPANEQQAGSIVAGTAADVDAAVRAAVAAFPTWAGTRPAERRQVLLAIAGLIEDRSEDFASAITAEMGAPRDNALQMQTLLPARVLRSYADLLSTFPFHEDVGHSVVVREPVGVVGAITPWNYPLYQIATKLGPALAAGCTMVLKPSETAPFDAMMLAELAIDAGLPAGVLNVVTGVGQVVGEALASHPAVDMVSFTGSTRVGRRISELGARTIKRVTLELGGKSASLVLPSAALEPAVRATVANAVYNSGQTCTAWTRLLVDHARYEEAVEIAADETKRQRLDDPQMPGDHLGPLATRAQFDKVRAMIRSGVERGARLVVGGAEAPAGLTNGFYVQPTLFADVTPDMMIAREEVFGPVLTAMSYTTVDEAVSIANDTDYGLAGAVWAGSDEEAWGVALRLRTGRVDLNGAPFNILAPTGGFKQSGNGRELGTYGLEEFCEMKSVQFSDPARLR